MTTSPSEGRSAPVVATVSVTDDDLVIAHVDGRTVSVPLAWYPRLLRGSREERTDWRLIGRGWRPPSAAWPRSANPRSMS